MKICHQLRRPPSSWTPTGSSDPDRESKLLCQIQCAIHQLDNSQFLRRFLSRLHHLDIQQPLNKLLTISPHIQIVAYGIGSIESNKVSRLQLALVLLLKRELGARVVEPIQVFDPILSVVECNVLAALGCRVIAVNERGQRDTVAPTIFFMPRCDLILYDNLLNANWKPMMLRRMVVLGNSFELYQLSMNLLRRLRSHVVYHEEDGRYIGLEEDGRHLLWIRRYVREVEMEESDNHRTEYDVELDSSKAFSGITWHFFELDDDADMGCLCKGILK